MMIRWLTFALALAAFEIGSAHAQTKAISVGVLEDQSGLYADASGIGSTLAAQMAVEDSGLEKQGWRINLYDADHQNKADVATGIARRWFDEKGVDVITGLGNSSIALAISALTKERNKIALVSGGGSSDLTGSACSPNTVQWTYDTYALANNTGTAITKGGGKKWFFVTADYSFGLALERDTTLAVQRAGGTVVGHARAPLNSPDFSSYLLQAQTSGADVVGFANAGNDSSTSIKQAAEFGIARSGQKIAALLMYLTDVHALGLKEGQGLNLTATFYWDLNEGTRDFGTRFMKRMRSGAAPTMAQAGVYAALLHYFKAVTALDEAERHNGANVVAKMKELPTDDALFGPGSIRIDGRALHPVYLFQVKTPEESHGPWDLYKLIATTPGEQAFRPLKDGGCYFVK